MRQLAAASMIAAIMAACSSDRATQPVVTAQSIVPPSIGTTARIEWVDVLAGGSGASNSCYLTLLVARVLDASGTVIRFPSIAWVIEDGPTKFVPIPDPVTSDGRIWKFVGATGGVGIGRIRASLPNSGSYTIFTVDYTPAQYDITFTDSH